MGVQNQPKRLSNNSPLGTAATTSHLSYTQMSSSVALKRGSFNKTSQVGYSDRRQIYKKNPNAPALSGAVNHLPLAIQAAFRRKVLAIFALQLFFVAAVVAAFEWIPSLKSAWRSAMGYQEYYIAIPAVATLVFLFALYKTRIMFPWNWVCLLLFSIALSLLYAGLGVVFDTSVGVINCGALFVWALVMIALSGVQVDKGDEPKLLSTYVSGGIGFVVVAAGVSGLYAIYTDSFMSQFGLVCTLALQLVMAIWFSYDAKGMFQVLTPDEYMQGVIYFYVDVLLLVLIAVVGAAGGGEALNVVYVGSGPMALAQATDVSDDQA